MSLDINWERILSEWLDPEACCAYLTERINKSLPEGAPLANLRVTQFDLRACQMPAIEFLDLTDIRDEFLLAAGHFRNIQSPPPSEEADDLLVDNKTGVIDAASLLYMRPAASLKDAIMQDGLEATVQFEFQDEGIRIEFEGDAVLNVPVSGFLALPLKFTLSKLAMAGKLILAVTPNFDRIFLTFPVPLTEFDLQLAVDVGDAEKHVLRNVAKVERFLLEQIKILLNDRMLLPQFIDLPLKIK